MNLYRTHIGKLHLYFIEQASYVVRVSLSMALQSNFLSQDRRDKNIQVALCPLF